MIISDGTLKKLITDQTIVITPLVSEALQPASIDCTLGDSYLMVDDNASISIDLDNPVKYRSITSKEITIPPHTFLLATTEQYIEIPNNITAFVEGRSSIGRMGLFIQNAGWVDPGFKGQITLELYNANSLPIRLSSGRRICQLVFCYMDEPALNPYKGKYNNQSGATASRVYLDKRIN
jgi:dCTP deaminase